jgi:AraC family transcriptional regulator
VVFVSHEERPVRGELRVAGRMVRAMIGNQTVSIAPPGLPLSSSWDGAGEVTAIYLKTGTESSRVQPQYWIQDPLIHAIGTALEDELSSPSATSGSYAESLGAALVAHIFAKYADTSVPAQNVRTQYTGQIGRSLEFIGDHLDRDLSLDELAAVANMSKFHFAKSFRQAMGIAPHQYLVKLRVEKARKLLALQTMSVEEVANTVGYTDKGHFAAQFRKIVGISPNRYLRSIPSWGHG